MRMKTIRTSALTALTSRSAVVVALLSLSLTFGISPSAADSVSVPTGRHAVAVDGKTMSVAVQGEGQQTVVLLPGFGTSAPILDFTPLLDELSSRYRVVVVEPFGYGYSDGTDKDRTTENIVDEIHQAVRSLGIDRYILMGHSISGIYALDYVAKYRNEVSAFVGIDSSVPGQPNLDITLRVEAFRLAKQWGLADVLALIKGEDEQVWSPNPAVTDEIEHLTAKNSFSDTYLNEMAHISANFTAAVGRTFPADLPVLLFAAQSSTIPGWILLHEGQAASVERGQVVLLDGDHYLHRTKSKEIGANLDRFLQDGNQR